MAKRILSLFRNLFRKRAMEQALDDELRSTLEDPDAGEDRARAFASGGPARSAYRNWRYRTGEGGVRVARVGHFVEVLVSDFRYGLRQLRRTGFTITAVLTLALGIGATTAIFTLVEQVMLQSLPVTRPDQLWRIGFRPHCCEWAGYSEDQDDDAPGNWNLFPYEAYKLFRANTTGFQDLAALQAGNQPLAVRRAGSAGLPETVNGEFVSGNFFQTLGVSAWRGRLLVDVDDREGAPPVAVMSFHAWQEKYGSDPSVVGATYQINGRAFTIVGVAPAGFIGANMTSWGVPDLWMPVATEPLMFGKTARMKNPRVDWLDLIGRVRPGTDPRALQAELQGELHGWLASHVADMSPQERAVWQKQTLRVSPGGAGFSSLRRYYSESLLLLMVTACCVLLVACANIANLLLARGLKNRQQTAVRVALGASRGRLVRNALIESVTLSLIGGAASVAVAWAGARLILYLAFHTHGTKVMDSGAGYTFGAGFAVWVGSFVADGSDLWRCTRVDELARRAGGGDAWRQP